MKKNEHGVTVPIEHHGWKQPSHHEHSYGWGWQKPKHHGWGWEKPHHGWGWEKPHHGWGWGSYHHDDDHHHDDEHHDEQDDDTSSSNDDYERSLLTESGSIEEVEDTGRFYDYNVEDSATSHVYAPNYYY